MEERPEIKKQLDDLCAKRQVTTERAQWALDNYQKVIGMLPPGSAIQPPTALQTHLGDLASDAAAAKQQGQRARFRRDLE
eukprot:7396272-Pyramimonas_sp.AAC.1